jgi:predicted RNA-binding Zn ribbon-like protein
MARGQPPLAADLADLNAALAPALARLRIVWQAERLAQAWDAPSVAPDWVTWHVARSALELLTERDPAGYGLCSGDGCSWLFYDLSRNHSRRWCSMQHCGNRMKVRRFYRRSQTGR